MTTLLEQQVLAAVADDEAMAVLADLISKQTTFCSSLLVTAVLLWTAVSSDERTKQAYWLMINGRLHTHGYIPKQSSIKQLWRPLRSFCWRLSAIYPHCLLQLH